MKLILSFTTARMQNNILAKHICRKNKCIITCDTRLDTDFTLLLFTMFLLHFKLPNNSSPTTTANLLTETAKFVCKNHFQFLLYSTQQQQVIKIMIKKVRQFICMNAAAALHGFYFYFYRML